MRVTLVSPAAPGAAPDLTGRWPPLGLAYLTAALEAHGHDATLIDAHGFALDEEATVARCVASSPELIGLSIYSPQIWAVAKLARALKQQLPEVPVLGGGPHATAMPHQTLVELPAIDYLLVGEADASLPTFVSFLEGHASRGEVPGLGYRTEGKGVVADGLPSAPPFGAGPSRPWLRQQKPYSPYFSLILGPLDSIVASRGCPYSCAFCSHMYAGCRPRGAESVVAEIAELRQRGIRNLDVQDDTFTAFRSRVLHVCERLASLGVGMRFRVRSRADTLDPTLLRSLRRAGVHVISLGLESGSQTMLSAMAKGISVEQGEAACRYAREAGLLVTTSWVIGFPGETPDTVADTVAFVRRVRPDVATFHRLQPFPGTAVYEQAKSGGLLRGDWSVADHAPWVQLDWLGSGEELDHVVAEAQRRCYQGGVGGLLRVAVRTAGRFDWQTWRAAGRLVWSLAARR